MTLALSALAMTAPRAAASIQSTVPCSATLNGQSASAPYTTANAIHVPQNSDATVTMQTASQVQRRQVFVSFGIGPKLSVSDQASPTSNSTTISVAKYASYGAGLYSVDVLATGTDGSTCEVQSYIVVDGNPLTTIAGAVAAALTALGVIGILLAALRALNPNRVGPVWRPRFSVLGIISGLIGGLAVVVVLQQLSVLFPSVTELVIALAAGVLLGVVLPSATASVGASRARLAGAVPGERVA